MLALTEFQGEPSVGGKLPGELRIKQLANFHAKNSKLNGKRC